MKFEHVNIPGRDTRLAVGAPCRFVSRGQEKRVLATVDRQGIRGPGRRRHDHPRSPRLGCNVTRLQQLFEDFCTCFNDADIVIVADVYEAGEEPIEGADRAHLVAGLRARGHRHVTSLEHPEDLAALIHEICEDGDFVVCLGAGSITNWAQSLPEELRNLQQEEGGAAGAGAGA